MGNGPEVKLHLRDRSGNLGRAPYEEISNSSSVKEALVYFGAVIVAHMSRQRSSVNMYGNGVNVEQEMGTINDFGVVVNTGTRRCKSRSLEESWF